MTSQLNEGQPARATIISAAGKRNGEPQACLSARKFSQVNVFGSGSPDPAHT